MIPMVDADCISHFHSYDIFFVRATSKTGWYLGPLLAIGFEKFFRSHPFRQSTQKVSRKVLPVSTKPSRVVTCSICLPVVSSERRNGKEHANFYIGNFLLTIGRSKFFDMAQGSCLQMSPRCGATQSEVQAAKVSNSVLTRPAPLEGRCDMCFRMYFVRGMSKST